MASMFLRSCFMNKNNNLELKKEALKIWITYLPNYIIHIITFFIPKYCIYEAKSILNLREELEKRRQKVINAFREEKELQKKLL